MPSNKPIVAITGASGFLGGELIKHFRSIGWQVRALVRDPSKYQTAPDITYVSYDMQSEIDDITLQGCTYLVHTAFIKQSTGLDAIALNAEAAERLLKASRAAGISRNVFVSSMSAHDTATSAYGLQKLAIEKLFDTARDISIRSGLIIGNGGLVKEMSTFMRTKHAVPLIGGGRQPLQTIAVYDLARVIEAALKSNKSGVVTIASPTIYTYKQFYQSLGKRLQVSFVFIPVPYVVLQAILRLADALHIKLGANEDNLIGLKNLRSFDTVSDLKSLKLSIDDLDTALKNTTID